MPGEAQRERPKHRWVVISAMALLVIAGGGLAWFQPWVPREESASIERMAFPLPDKPSIAVLSFTNMSGDPEQEYFADGISEDLTTDLSKISGLFVIARNSAFSYKGRNVKVQQVAEELGVRYVLEGSVRRVGDTVRVNAQLIDTTTGGHLWAERYDGSLANIFTLQDRVTRDIVGALSISLTEDEHAALTREGAVDPRALDALLRGWSYYRRNSPEDYAKAIAHLEEALTIDPDYERAHAALAAVYQSALNRGFTAGLGEWSRTLGIRPDDILKNVRTHLERTRASPTPLVHRVTSQLRSFQGRFDDALREAELAIALNANDPVGYEAMAAALILGGRPAEGAEQIRKAMRLDPRYPGEYLFWFGLAKFGQGRFERAAEPLERAASIDLADERPLIVLTSAYGHLGRTDEARATVEKLNELRSAREERRKRAPEGDVRVGIDVFLLGPYTLVDVNMWPFKEVADRERLREGLRLAGVPKTGPETAESPIEVDGATTVDVAEAKALYDRSVLFVDVRSLVDWNIGHIPEAAHLELQKVFSEAALLKLVAKDGEVVIHCEGPKCLRSSKACAKAAAWGFTRVYYFRDGFPAWRAAGYPVAVVSE